MSAHPGGESGSTNLRWGSTATKRWRRGGCRFPLCRSALMQTECLCSKTGAPLPKKPCPRQDMHLFYFRDPIDIGNRGLCTPPANAFCVYVASNPRLWRQGSRDCFPYCSTLVFCGLAVRQSESESGDYIPRSY